MFVDGKHETFADFYHGESVFAEKAGYYEPDYTGIDTLMLYTLTPGVTSSFKNLQICEDICPDADKDTLLASAMGRYNSIHIIIGVIINIMIVTFSRELYWGDA